jgi:hypothetical protein
VVKPEGKKPIGRPRHWWEDNIKMYIRQTGWSSMDWNHLSHGRDQKRADVNMVMNLQVP